MKVSISWTAGGKSSVSFESVGRAKTTTHLPTAFTARFEYELDHTVELDVRVKDGLPTCEAVRVERNAACPPLSGRELRRLPVANMVEFACAQAGVVLHAPGSMSPPTSDAEFDEVAEDVAVAVRRRRVDDGLLRDVAAAYVEHGRDVQSLREVFHVSLSQAHRYLKAARERGFITEESQS